MKPLSVLGVLGLLAVLAGCSGKVKTYPVSGELFVDNKPAEDAFVYFHPVDENPNNPRPFGQVDRDGKFAISSLVQGDGAPAGEYIVTFEWRERSGIFKQNFDGPDRLKGAYFDKARSQHRVMVGKEPMVLPRFDLKAPK